MYLFKKASKLFSHNLLFDLYYASKIKVIPSDNEGQVHMLYQLAVPQTGPMRFTKAEKAEQAPGGGPRQHLGARRELPWGVQVCTNRKKQMTKAGDCVPAARERSLLPENCLDGCFQHLLWLLLKSFSDKVSNPSRG